MFSFSKKKETEPTLADMLKLDDSAFVRAVRAMLQRSHEQACAMCVVAYQNLDPWLAATYELAKQTPTDRLPTDLDGFIHWLIPLLENPEHVVAGRRLGWFLQAALIKRASERANSNPNLDEHIVDIWIMLAKGAALLHEVVERNILWSEDEKEWFADIKDEKSGIWYCLNILVPALYRQHPRIEDFAKAHGITLCSV
jgi:hypothetical protein